jgi:hypothetical protein
MESSGWRTCPLFRKSRVRSQSLLLISTEYSNVMRGSSRNVMYNKYTSDKVALGGLVFSFLTIGSMVRRLKSGRGRSILLAQQVYLQREVKPSAPCHKILRHVKEPYRYEKRYFVGKIRGHFSPSFSWFANRLLCPLLPDGSGEWIRNEPELRWGRTIDQKWSQCLGRLVWYHPATVTLTQTTYMRVQVITAANMKMMTLWDIAPCSLVEVGRHLALMMKGDRPS